MINKTFLSFKKGKVLTFLSLFFLTSCSSFSSRAEFAGFNKKALFSLMEQLEVKHDNTEEGIVKETQKAWLRSGERWETADLHEERKETLRPLFDDLELVNEWEPHYKQYDGVLLLGSTFFAMQAKTRYLDELVKKNPIAFNKLVVLTGERFLLEKEKDALKELGADLTKVKTEADMIRFWLEQDDAKRLFIPKEVEFIDVPAHILEDGTKKRPTTADTVNAWLKNGASPGVYLAFSLQPHCRYQKAVLTSLLPATYIVDVAGGSDNYTNRVAVYLDAITRTLYASQKKK